MEEDVPPSITANVSVDLSGVRKAISPYIYGSNQDFGSRDRWTVRRLGGNRLTGYNWENDFSNAGSDYMHSSDEYLLNIFGLSGSSSSPARVMRKFHDLSNEMGAESMLTLQLAGFVSADNRGPVSEGETATSARWDSVLAKKPSAFSMSPSRSDGLVYMDEFVNFMVETYGSAATEQGVRWYALDNEPGLWAETHPRIHPEPVGVKDLVERSIKMALAVKAVDPDAKIVGPALYGFAAYETLQGAPDWPQEQVGSWFIDYYLDKMREAEEVQGIRLLDVLDVHWYPEARGDNRIVFGTALTEKDVAARLQAPRTLWDGTYVEDSWIGEWKQSFLPLLPNLHSAIETYYPGTKLAITEYNYGASSSISGGLAQTDVLGIFGTHDIHIASLWQMEENNSYISGAFDLYRNYDGAGNTFGDTSVETAVDDPSQFSAYASIHGGDASQLHVIAINKNKTETAAFEIDVDGGASYSEAEVWVLDVDSSILRRGAAGQVVGGNTLTYNVPAFTAVHIVLK